MNRINQRSTVGKSSIRRKSWNVHHAIWWIRKSRSKRLRHSLRGTIIIIRSSESNVQIKVPKWRICSGDLGRTDGKEGSQSLLIVRPLLELCIRLGRGYGERQGVELKASTFARRRNVPPAETDP